LQTLLNWWAAGRQRYYVHAAAVGTPSGGVLLAGQSGSGKSTTTLACVPSKLAVAADDYTLVAVDAVPRGFSLYNTVKLKSAEDLQRFPHLLPYLSNGDRLYEEKPMLFLHEHHARSVLRDFPIKAILLPRVRGGTGTGVQRSSAAAALRALAPSTLLQLPGTGQSAFHAMARLTARVPCYTLALGTDLAQVPDVMLRLLEELP
jgi:hypothetical protein